MYHAEYYNIEKYFQEHSKIRPKNKCEVESEQSKTSDKYVISLFGFILFCLFCIQIGFALKSGQAIFSIADDTLLNWGLRCFSYIYPLLVIFFCLIYLNLTR